MWYKQPDDPQLVRFIILVKDVKKTAIGFAPVKKPYFVSDEKLLFLFFKKKYQILFS